MAALAISTSFNCSSIPSYSTKTSSFRRRTSIVSVSTNPYNDSSFPGLSSKIDGLFPKLEQSALLNSGLSNGPIQAYYGNMPIMPAVVTPGGMLDLSYVLFRNRTIFIGQYIGSQVAERVISQLVTLATIDENSDILIYLNCPGGNLYSTLAIYDVMSWIKPKVGTVCFGIAASQGALLLAGGEKGMRYAMPNSRIMTHQPYGEIEGNVYNARGEFEEGLQNRNKVVQMYAAFSGQSIDRIEQHTDRDRFLSVTEALEFGLIDGVLETVL